MSRAKNRCITRGLVHAVKRKSNYRYLLCNGVVVYNSTDKDMVLTCLICIAEEFRDLQRTT